MVQSSEIKRTQKALLTVIIPVYNAAKHLHKCLDSVRSQTYQHLEIICVDDGSTDESPSILDQYANMDPRFVVIHQSNMGAAVARNVALDRACGDFVIGLDSDDFLESTCYEKALLHMTEGVDIVVFGVHPIGSDRERQGVIRKWTQAPFTGIFDVDAHTPTVLTNHIWNKIFRRDIIERYCLRFPNNCWLEDIAFTQSYLAVCKKGYYLPDKLYYYLVHDDSVTGHTKGKSVKMLCIFTVIDSLYSFYQNHGLWKNNLSQVEEMFKFLSWAMSNIPENAQELARNTCQDFIKKWELQKIFPYHWFIRKYYVLSLRESIISFFIRLFYTNDRTKLKIRFLGIPIYQRIRNEETNTHQLLWMKIRKITHNRSNMH